MNDDTNPDAPCGCGSGKKSKDCCGTPKPEVTNMRVKDLRDFELMPGLAGALSASLDPAYHEYFVADLTGKSTKEAERQLAAIPENKRYLTRVLDSLDTAFAPSSRPFDTGTMATARSAQIRDPHRHGRDQRVK